MTQTMNIINKFSPNLGIKINVAKLIFHVCKKVLSVASCFNIELIVTMCNMLKIADCR